MNPASSSRPGNGTRAIAHWCTHRSSWDDLSTLAIMVPRQCHQRDKADKCRRGWACRMILVVEVSSTHGVHENNSDDAMLSGNVLLFSMSSSWCLEAPSSNDTTSFSRQANLAPIAASVQTHGAGPPEGVMESTCASTGDPPTPHLVLADISDGVPDRRSSLTPNLYMDDICTHRDACRADDVADTTHHLITRQSREHDRIPPLAVSCNQCDLSSSPGGRRSRTVHRITNEATLTQDIFVISEGEFSMWIFSNMGSIHTSCQCCGHQT